MYWKLRISIPPPHCHMYLYFDNLDPIQSQINIKSQKLINQFKNELQEEMRKFSSWKAWHVLSFTNYLWCKILLINENELTMPWFINVTWRNQGNEYLDSTKYSCIDVIYSKLAKNKLLTENKLKIYQIIPGSKHLLSMSILLVVFATLPNWDYLTSIGFLFVISIIQKT